MMPEDAARALLDNLGLPDGVANVLVWYDGTPPSLRVWVEERYLWQLRQQAPEAFEGYRVNIEKRPAIQAN